jgi:aspartate 1-decarboxylase
MMQIQVLKSKIHRATVTDANINYVGSVTVDEALMKAANLLEFEKVQVLNINNGERIETYVIRGKKGSGVICLNGAAARKFLPNDVVIIVSYATMDFEAARKFKPSIVFPGKGNKISTAKKR